MRSRDPLLYAFELTLDPLQLSRGGEAGRGQQESERYGRPANATLGIARDIGFTRLDGSTRDRSAVVRRFQEDDAIPVMLISLKAGGTGLNLTAADHIFLLDPWWNPAVEDQAADRAHRIGQTRPVMIYRLVALDTVDERILELQQRKRELADLALEGTGAATSLSRDDLKELLA